MSDEEECHDQRHREKSTNKTTMVELEHDSDNDSDKDWEELFYNPVDEDSSEGEGEEEP